MDYTAAQLSHINEQRERIEDIAIECHNHAKRYARTMGNQAAAELLGVSGTTLKKIERGEYHPYKNPACGDFLYDQFACGPHEICNRCGRRVKMPCVACSADLKIVFNSARPYVPSRSTIIRLLEQHGLKCREPSK